MATAKVLDMTNVREGGASFAKKRLPEGDYLAKVTKVEDTEVKKGDNKGQSQWLFTIVPDKHPTAKYPYYCGFAENQLWKIRNLCIAAGLVVPKKRLKLDPEKLVGKTIAITLEDDEYDGKAQSNVAAIFPPAEMDGAEEDDEEEPDDDEDEEDEEDEPTPPPAKKTRRKPEPEPEPEPEDDEDEEEDEEEEEPPAKPVKKAKRKVTDEELDELDIDEV